MKLVSDKLRAFGPALNIDEPYVDLEFYDVSLGGEVEVNVLDPNGQLLPQETFTLERLSSAHSAGDVVSLSLVPDDGKTHPDLPDNTIGYAVVVELYDLYEYTGNSDFLNASRDAFRGLRDVCDSTATE